MLRTLLTPLSAAFGTSPSQPNFPGSPGPDNDELDPEDFARDVLVEIMRNSVERLKVAEGLKARTEELTEIHKIMCEDSCTKDVFREMDGFLVLMSILSTIQPAHSWPVAEPGDQIVIDVLEATRLIFAILDEGLFQHDANVSFFERSVGYDSLEDAIKPLLSDEKTSDQTLGYLFALAMHNFSLSSIFSILSNCDTPLDYSAIDSHIENLDPLLSHSIRHAGALQVMFSSVPCLPSMRTEGEERQLRRYFVYKLIERLCMKSHRNHALIGGLGLVSHLFDALCPPPVIHNGEGDVPASPTGSSTLPKPERSLLLRLLKKLLELGCSSEEARTMFKRALRPKPKDAVETSESSSSQDEYVLDADVLEVLRAGTKARWPQHFSLEGRSGVKLVVPSLARGFPRSGFTFMTWLWIEKLPGRVQDIASYHVPRVGMASASTAPLAPVFALRVFPDGALEYRTRDTREKLSTKMPKGKWTHVALVGQPQLSRNEKPAIRLFVNGERTELVNAPYPRSDWSTKDSHFIIGDTDVDASMSWSFASAYFLSAMLGDEIPRFIYYLSPRYTASFRAGSELVKFMTYEAATSLSIHVFNVSNALAQLAPSHEKSQRKKALDGLMNAVKYGLQLDESDVIMTVAPNGKYRRRVNSTGSEDEEEDNGEANVGWFEGEVLEMQTTPLDLSMWKLGGAAVALGLLQYASTPHELSRTLSILAGGLKNSWQNSEDMERIRGYEIIAGILRAKPHLINITGFETIFEFLGLNFKNPDLSTITNVAAYRPIALDFILWTRTKPEIQRAHLSHFTTLLSTSVHRKYNAAQLLSPKNNINLLRKLLFVLQTEWYDNETTDDLIDILRSLLEKKWDRDTAIKPLIAYLAANLHDADSPGNASPRSMVSYVSTRTAVQQKAMLVLSMLVKLLYSSPAHYSKLLSCLPLPRVYLLLLGPHPTPSIASQILRLIQLSLRSTSSFGRKFELVSGWSVLKLVLPEAWGEEVKTACFDILLGRPWAATTKGKEHETESDVVSCPSIVPSILATLQAKLDIVGNPGHRDADDVQDAAAHAEKLLEELIQLHGSSSTFRQVFKSQTTTSYFVDAYRTFVMHLSNTSATLELVIVRILEKMSHFGLSIALDTAVAAEQKQEILDILQTAEAILNSIGVADTSIDTKAIAPKRPRRSRFGSSRLSVQLGEKTVRRTITRIEEWRKTVIATERKRLRQAILDIREEQRQVAGLTEWQTLLTAERGLWPKHFEGYHWRLDETEGPYRIRRKLEPDLDVINSKIDTTASFDKVHGPDSDWQSVAQTEVPPWAETYDIASTDTEERQLADEVHEDKHRRIRHELEPGDVIEAAHTVARIQGVDSSPGLLILGRTHLYMLDGVVQNHNGEVIDAHDAPKELFFVPGSIVELDGPQLAQRWSYDQILNYSDRTFLFRDVALEFYFRDSRSLLVVFLDKKQRQATNNRLSHIINGHGSSDSLTPGGALKSPLNLLSAKVSATAKASARALMGFRLDELATAQRRWQAREISNFGYICILNQLSGRTPNDATQYPVFPWVLSDYTSSKLDLSSNSTFRDLTRPMGALTPSRREAAETRYRNLESVGEKPFHYGTHFSSSMIVCHFLIRLAPYTNMFKTLQGGDWDLPDRLFADIKRAWDSAASQDLRGDVRELIPEFFSCPEFLENSANLDFGVQQNTGERIHDVKLPPWAKNDPLLFIEMNRQALESDYVSHNLPAWIDLIWGYKQGDPNSLNVFHPLSYEGAIDLDSIIDPLEREATVGIIHNFGQTPRKLFNAPHPDRMMHGCSTLPIGIIYGIPEDYHLLAQSSKVLRDLGNGNAVHELALDMIGERVIPCTKGQIIVPSHPHELVEWDVGQSGSGDLRILSDRRVVQVVEAVSCRCATFADADTLVTGSADYTVRLWRLNRNTGQASTPRYPDSPLKVVPTHLMRSHEAPVVSVAASRTWSMVVSGSEDGSAAIWDLNRGCYVRSIWHGHGLDWTVHLTAIQESTGYIATCSRDRLWLHTINARPVASLDLTGLAVSPTYPPITSLAFHEREYTPVPVIAAGAPDGTITLRTWNADNTPEGEKAKWEFVTLRTLKVKTAQGERMPRPSTPAVTALRFVGESLYHGEDSGKVFSWDLPD
ncbi:beach-domain-containing protein [Panus rudis PR-1116 ss-1]|nr:beach-domain-containing protein [Panus rudis PR-1116 ss-1]